MSSRKRGPSLSTATSAPMAKKFRRNSYVAPQSVESIVRKELRKKTDFKITDASTVSANVSSSGTIQSLLTNLVRGDNAKDNFQGSIIKPQGLYMKYNLHTNQEYNSCRVLVFQWFDSGTPAVTGVLETNATNLGTLSPKLWTNSEFIKVLYDKHVIISPSAGGDSTVIGQGVFCDTLYIPGRRLRRVKYNSTTNVIQDGNIYVLFISDDSLTSYPVINYYSRVTFADQ